MGYTIGMKTAISIPDAVFEGVDRLARRTKRSRSRIVSEALVEYLARHSDDDVTAMLNEAVAEVEPYDQFLVASARSTFERSDW